jgi:NhaP-type Na+/H+ or K+/H+ antiporter
VAVGYGVALLSQIVIFPLYGMEVPLSANIQIGVWFTVISIIRSYLLRRCFNKWTDR